MCDHNKLLKTHHKISDARTALKRAYEAADRKYLDQLEKLEAVLAAILNESFGIGGPASMSGSEGIFFREETITPRADDWDRFYKWVAENDAFEALEKRVTKVFVKKFMEDNKDENGVSQLPPGISVFRKYVVRVRRAK